MIVVLDGDFASDQPDLDAKKAGGEVTIGGGPILTRGIGSNEKLFHRAIEVARREKIPFQVKGIGGGTWAPTPTS